jgi:PhnB protein
MQINAYLYFSGDCKAAFKFYQEVLGGEITAMMPHAGTPAEEHAPPEWRDKIMHARLIVNGQVLMGSDSPPEYYSKPQGFSVSAFVEGPAEAERIFNAFSEGGEVTMPMEQTFFAERFGMLVDRYGTRWMVGCEPAK